MTRTVKIVAAILCFVWINALLVLWQRWPAVVIILAALALIALPFWWRAWVKYGQGRL